MTTSIIIVFVASSAFVWCLSLLAFNFFFGYQEKIDLRLREFDQEHVGPSDVSLFKDFNVLGLTTTKHGLSFNDRIVLLIEQSGIQCTSRMFYVWTAATALTCAPIGFCRGWIIGLLGAAIGALLPYFTLHQLKRIRYRKLCRQLPEAFSAMSRAVRSGQTVPAAMQMIAEDFDQPISSEFSLCHEQQNLGLSRESTLRKMAARFGIMELQIFVVALLVQARSGGDLVELLDNLAGMIRKRMKLKNRVRALTGEGRMQAAVLITLPLFALLGTLILAPSYAQELLDRPWLLAGTAFAQVLGAIWISRIINFEY